MIVTLCSTDIAWENKNENFKNMDFLLASLTYKSDVIVFPEMFSTGFTMNVSFAEDMNGESIRWMQKTAARYDTAIVASLPFRESVMGIDDRIYNRAFFVYPNGQFVYYDKRHLFRMARENGFYTAGKKQVVAEYKGVRFALSICYDIRFPVWSRNLNNQYDVLINVANFPLSRVKIIDPLVKTRALENMAYMAFVNRVGADEDCEYTPSSMFVDYKGNNIGQEQLIPSKSANANIQIIKGKIDIEKLRTFRVIFPVWLDADTFKIDI